jgi:hypothetical protein
LVLSRSRCLHAWLDVAWGVCRWRPGWRPGWIPAHCNAGDDRAGAVDSKLCRDAQFMLTDRCEPGNAIRLGCQTTACLCESPASVQAHCRGAAAGIRSPRVIARSAVALARDKGLFGRVGPSRWAHEPHRVTLSGRLRLHLRSRRHRPSRTEDGRACHAGQRRGSGLRQRFAPGVAQQDSGLRTGAGRGC